MVVQPINETQAQCSLIHRRHQPARLMFLKRSIVKQCCRETIGVHCNTSFGIPGLTSDNHKYWSSSLSGGCANDHDGDCVVYNRSICEKQENHSLHCTKQNFYTVEAYTRDRGSMDATNPLLCRICNPKHDMTDTGRTNSMTRWLVLSSGLVKAVKCCSARNMAVDTRLESITEMFVL